MSSEKKLGRFEILMFAAELPAKSAVTLCFEHAQQFHILHIT